MDWVKPKHRARQLKSTEPNEAAISASNWLKQLCEENVALLQSSLPVRTSTTKVKRSHASVEKYLQAMLWGTGVWEVEHPSRPEYLHDLVGSFTPSTAANGVANVAASNRKPSRISKRAAVDATTSALQVTAAKKIGKWITQQLPKSSHDPYVALVCAGWIHALPEVGRDIPASLWLEVLQCSLTQIDRAWDSGPIDGLFPWIVWSCEVPLALAKQLSQLGGKDRIVSETLNRLALLIEDSADDPGKFLQHGGQDLRAILGSIIRCRWSADAVGARKWYPPQRKALAKLAQAAVALSDTEGKQLLFDESDTSFDADFFTSLVQLAGQNKKLLLATGTSLPDVVGKQLELKPARLRKDKTLDVSLPKISQYWDKNSIATMRRSWREPGCRIAVDFSSDVIWLDVLDENGERVFSGDWDVTVSRNGKPQLVNVSWQEVCWFTDDDVDYLELECEVEDTCKIQRQVMLMREEGMVYFADALIANEPSQWTIESIWKVADRVHLVPESKTNECRLMRSGADESNVRTVALVLPVAMPEWRRSPTHSRLTSQGSNMVLSTSSNGQNLYSPLVVSLRGASRHTAFTWRQLTIAEELAIQTRDKAEAYRVQINKDHWVFYRSLTPCVRRTVMGLHLLTEFYAARFTPDDGQFEPMIEVNPE